MADTCRILFTGDIMCHLPQMEACKTETGYDFTRVFAHLGGLLEAADYVVGNLETPISPDDTELSYKRYNFNTPYEFLKPLKDAGFDFFATANNHSVDRGMKGVIDTVDMLDKWGFAHTGTARDAEERDKPVVIDINGTKVGFINYTYGINAFFNQGILTDENAYAVNLLMPQEGAKGSIDLQSYATIGDYVKEYYNNDSATYKYVLEKYVSQIERDIKAAKAAGAEFTVFILHSGGQYNPEPDEYSIEIARRIERMGADIIVGHHPHRVHRTDKFGACPVLFSLGNFTFTPSPTYRRDQITCPEADYSVVFALTLEKSKLGKMEFSICKSVINADEISEVWPVRTLYDALETEAERQKLIDDVRAQAELFCPKTLKGGFELKDWYEFIV